MELLGVGPLEFILILVIVLLLFSPKDIVGGARQLGRMLNRLYRSDTFRVVQKTSEELRDLPNLLAREATLDELEKLPQELDRELKQAGDIHLPKISDPESAPAPNIAPPPAPARPAEPEPPKTESNS